MQQLLGSMSKLKVGKRSKSTALTLRDQLPPRPSYGSNGTPVVLWANYFTVATTLDVLYKYTMEVKEIKEESEVTSQAQGRAIPQAPGRPQTKEVKGRKLFLVIRAVLDELCRADPSLVIATEFKNQLISLSRIDIPTMKKRVSIPSPTAPERVETFDVIFHGPSEARVDNIMKYLGGSPGTEAGDSTFPRYPEVVDALNVIFGHGLRSQLDCISAVGGSRFFLVTGDKVASQQLISNRRPRPLEAVRGYFQSLRLGTGRLLLNVNVTHGVFKLSGAMEDLFRSFHIGEVKKNDYRGLKNLRTFSKFLPKTRVMAQMKLSNGKTIQRQKVIYGLAQASEIRRPKGGGKAPQISGNMEFAGPRNVSFWLEQDGKPGCWITVFDYYQQKYGISLKDYPLLNLGTADKPTYFPAEFVTIRSGQSVKVKLQSDETTHMLNFACRSPYANAFSITNEGRDTLGLDDGSLERFGLSVDKKLLTVQGRILPIPKVEYLLSAVVVPKDASWDLRNLKVFKAGTKIERWSYLNLSTKDCVPKETVVKFARFMVGMGIDINPSPVDPEKPVISYNSAMGPELDMFFKWAQSNKIEFLLLMLGGTETDVYNRIKVLGDCIYGIQTSCVQASPRKFGGGSPQYFANVALKWNLKAGGINHRLGEELDLLKKGTTMVVGYDVTHPTNMPSGKGDGIPSLVGLVSSIDRDMGQWPSVSWEQNSKQEMVGDRLTTEFITRLELWQAHNQQRLPENIVIFRDGVSEGQFTQVLDDELPLIRAAFQSKYKKAAPQLTIVVSVKRHHTRFYPTNEKDALRNGNVRNGTVVDRGVTQARLWDFFLTAHAAIKGTARPAHYTVLLDEIFRARYKSEAANELEKFTHELCYLFGRATKAVSICPPAYYADIVCTRARAHRPEYNDTSDTESIATMQSASMSTIEVHERLRNTMYYI
ncbi:ribonuclease H-like domain-containing protein [Mariannaea sp. PMI_226]|nr:ribonuclease H-like domain-containing protein [Mariannaea sp. PMI_226]